MSLLAELIGESPGIVAVREQVGQLLQRLSDTRRLVPILIQGETGTGKGVFARAIHRAGARAAGPFVDVNCAAIPESLLEAELFGFERGAFTDARQAKAGLFQTAHRGTLFLDEVGLLPEALQAKLLTVLEDRTVRRLGGTRSEPVDVWILTATSEDLEAAIRARRFREDLYHRLAVVTLRLPPLRERGQDVLRLAEHFLARACADYNLAPKTLAPEARAALLAYRWPGNVRELGNVMERVALLSEAPVVTPERLALPKARSAEPREPAPEGETTRLADVDEETERASLLEALRETDWNVSRAAARLRVSRNTLRYRIEKHGLRGAGAPGGPERAPAREAPAGQPGPALPAAAARDAAGPAAAGGAVPAPAAGIRWERRHVALLRVDLVAPAADVPAGRALETVVEKVQSFGGRVEELGPMRVTAAFGLEPLEDAPRRAAHAAMAIEKAAERARRGAAEIPGARIGLHVGQVMVARAGGAVLIDHDARREAWALLESLMARAEPETVLVSEAARPFLERRFALLPAGAPDRAPPGACRLGGVERTGLGLGARMAPFVGRQQELALLERCCEEASQGALRIVDVVGEAGIGKSRLAHELRGRLEGRAFVFLHGHCTTFGGSTPFLPFIEVARSAFLIGEGEGPEEVTARLRRGLERLGLPADASLPFLQLLLGLEVEGTALRGLNGEIVGARTREALHRILRARCRLAPLVLILDDLHWTDTASEELVLRLVESEEPLPLVVICGYRAPYRPPWAGRPGVTELRLGPLAEEHCLRLVQHRLGAEALPRALARQVVEKAEGNPLFAEEITRYLLESGRLHADAAVPIPETLQHLLMARVERLDEGARTVLQVASVVGRRFSVELVRAVSGAGDATARHLRDLEAQELVFRQEAEGREEYRFKHVLVQSAVYESLLAPQREELHQRVAEAIEWLYATRLGEWVEVLAHHYGRTPRVDKTVRFLALAGQRSLRMYSLEEADRRCRQVVELIETVPGCADEAFLADAILEWIQVYYYRKDFKGLIALVERYRPGFEALGDARRLSLLLFWLGFSHFFGMRCDTARPLLKKALALGEALGDEACIGHALMGLMFTYWVKRGDEPRDVVDRVGERALAVAERLGDVYLQTQCLHGLGLHAFTGGRYREARALGRRLIELGRSTGAVRPVATGLHVVALVDVYEERHQEAIEHAEESLRASPDTADRLIARTVKGAALALSGRSHRGLALLRDVRREIVANDYLVLLTGVDYPYGFALVLAGRMAAGVRWIEDSIRRFTAWGNESIPAVGHMILGEIHLRMVLRGDRPPFRVLLRNLGFLLLTVPFAAGRARRHLERAIRIARDVGMPAVLARSLLDLGLLGRATGERAEARAHLGEARRIADALDLPVLSEKIRAALEVETAPRASRQRAA